MDEAINFLNVEIGVFLRYLRCFSKIENVQISKKTVELMQESILSMKELSLNAKVIENSVKNDVDFLFGMDEHQYELKRHIFCRSCYEMFPLSENDFIVHLHKKHYGTTSIDSNSFLSDFIPETESTTYQFNEHSKTSTSPNISDGGHHLSSAFSDHGFAEDNNFSQSSGTGLRYSDIVRNVALPTEPDEPVVNIKPIDIFMTLGDMIRTDRCFEAISLQMVDFMTRTNQRTQDEANILELLTTAVNSFDRALKVLPFGSVEYSFSGSNTNYNILVDTRKSEKSSALLLRTFQKYFIHSDAQQYFDIPAKIDSNRLLKQQLKIIHKKSGIECFMLFDNDVNPIKSIKIINDFITLKPVCRQLIAYVRAWQNVVNGLAVQNGDIAFQFNTYIISVLVIFFLQVHYDLPAANDIMMHLSNNGKIISSERSVFEEQKDFGRILLEFYHFYGARYEINNHLISAQIGRWQEQRLTGRQKYFTPEQKRLRDGMNENVTNWQNCTMFVQDLVSPGLNIAAEVSKEEAHNFQGMCQMFSTLQKHSAPKRIPKLSPPSNAPVRRATSLTTLPSSKPCVNPTKVIKVDRTKPAVSLLKKVAAKKGTVKNPSTTLDEAIKSGKVYELITAEMVKLSSRSDERIRHESRILGMLKHEFKIFDRTLELIPFGSTTFGFGSSDSNYNILVDTRKSQQVQALVLESFEKYLAKTDIQLNFDGIAEIPASRTLNKQLRMIHKESGIHVLLLADDVAVAETQRILRDFISIKPICRRLIEYVMAWQNALKTILSPIGTSVFQFNTYMISVLVIFFMQVNYDVPMAQDVHAAMKKTNSSMQKDLLIIDKMLADFFWFYGQRYQIWNHVISLNIGRWQERRIQDQQKWFLPNQKSDSHSRLRDGISSNMANWKNCTMYVEDVIRTGINIAAEITTKDAYGFQEMCQAFAKKNICYKICHINDED